jgi:hypothetical protein
MMGLLSALKSRLFSPELCRVAKTGDMAAVARCLAREPVVVIGADLGDSFLVGAQPDAVFKTVGAVAQKKSFEGEIHKYEIDGEIFVPVFSDSAAAELFCGAYCSLLGRIHAFRLFTVPGAYIRHWIADGDTVVVNPQSSNEVEIDPIRSQDMCMLLPKPEGLNDAQFLSLVLPCPGISSPIEFLPGE